MVGLGIIIGWGGYAVMYYGITQVQSGNWGFLDLIVPGRWTAAVANTPKDTGQTSNAQVNQPPAVNPKVSPATSGLGGGANNIPQGLHGVYQ
jgi:hypothetical protein